MNIRLEITPAMEAQIFIEIQGKVFLVEPRPHAGAVWQLGLAAIELSAGATMTSVEFGRDRTRTPWLDLISREEEGNLGCVLNWRDSSQEAGVPFGVVAGEIVPTRDFLKMVLGLLWDLSDMSGKDHFEKCRNRCAGFDSIRNRLAQNLGIKRWDFLRERAKLKADSPEVGPPPKIEAVWRFRPVMRICPRCNTPYELGLNGVWRGCDRCLGIERDGDGYAWLPREKKRTWRLYMENV